MKSLVINNRKLFYEVNSYEVDEYGGLNYETKFYDTEPTIKTITRKKYFLFGPVITLTKEKYKKLFTLKFNVENPKYKKEDVRDALYEKLNILKRKEEIKRGEIV